MSEQNQNQISSSKKSRAILPANGIWTVEDLANWLGIDGNHCQQALSNRGIKVITFSSRYKHKLFRLEDLKGSETPET